ncbi:MAG TPA: hypothetical protein EYN41_10685 [Flavobacteriales bacterium]|nr:hypothetical protein [Flavobacteriales bacterium]
MRKGFTGIVLILVVLCATEGTEVHAQDNALVLANSRTKQFRHIRMNRWVVIKLKGGNRFHSWFIKGVNDSSIVMSHACDLI